MGIQYYYPSDAEEAQAPAGVEIEVHFGQIALMVDATLGQPAQVVELTVEEAMSLAGALNWAALCALPGGGER